MPLSRTGSESRGHFLLGGLAVGCQVLIDSGIYLDGAIAANPTVPDSVAVWGRTDRMPAIQVNWLALVRTRTLLRQGKAVFLLVNDRPGGALHPAILRMAARLNCELFLFSVDLSPTGTVLVRFFQAEGCGEEAATTALRDEVKRIVERRSVPGLTDRKRKLFRIRHLDKNAVAIWRATASLRQGLDRSVRCLRNLVVVFQAEVRDQVFASHPAQGVLQLH